MNRLLFKVDTERWCLLATLHTFGIFLAVAVNQVFSVNFWADGGVPLLTEILAQIRKWMRIGETYSRP